MQIIIQEIINFILTYFHPPGENIQEILYCKLPEAIKKNILKKFL